MTGKNTMKKGFWNRVFTLFYAVLCSVGIALFTSLGVKSAKGILENHIVPGAAGYPLAGQIFDVIILFITVIANIYIICILLENLRRLIAVYIRQIRS